MQSRRLRAPLLALLALVLVVPITASTAHADRGDSTSKTTTKRDDEREVRSKKARRHRARKARRNRARKQQARRRGQRGFRGDSVGADELRDRPLPEASGNVWIWSENFREEVRVNIYDADGSFNDEALAELDEALRCRRTGEHRAVDPRLYEVLSIIQDHFDGARVSIVSGFRFQRNEGSRHYHAAAMDIRIPGVSMRELYKVADSLDRGGMGVGRYPRSGFVHIDFRAPGDPSYRWTDRSGPGKGKRRGKRPSRQWTKRNKPNT